MGVIDEMTALLMENPWKAVGVLGPKDIDIGSLEVFGESAFSKDVYVKMEFDYAFGECRPAEQIARRLVSVPADVRANLVAGTYLWLDMKDRVVPAMEELAGQSPPNYQLINSYRIRTSHPLLSGADLQVESVPARVLFERENLDSFLHGDSRFSFRLYGTITPERRRVRRGFF